LAHYDLRAILVHFYPMYNVVTVFFRCVAGPLVVLPYCSCHCWGNSVFFVRPGSPLFRAHRAVVLGDSSGAFGHNRALADVPTTLGSATALRAVAFMTLRKGKTLSCRI
jgi:hypothetical protein